MIQPIVLWEAWATGLGNKALIHCWERTRSQCNKFRGSISEPNANQVVWVGGVLYKKVAALKQGGNFLLCVLYFRNSLLGVAFSTSLPLSTNYQKEISRCKLYILTAIASHLEERITIRFTTLIPYLFIFASRPRTSKS